MLKTRKSFIWRSATAAAATALVGVAGAAAALPASADDDGGHKTTEIFRGDLQDLATSESDPFEGASAKVRMAWHDGHTRFVLRVWDIDSSAEGISYGAHLHEGPCVEGDPDAAGPHYNVSKADPKKVNDRTEVWLDFTVEDDGTGYAVARVPFVPKPGDRSVVIHEESTDPDTGLAGTRLACLPVEW